ncbi:caspase domain protein [Candidatus Methanoplasma termitum]|uniref:Caspase domain protein n=1 Tax=Candidatus Methanoplasma termitum TaxID=1577791 RepID=A0A0A7LCH3_9ARCH|nr:caspase family protein [Candidatus Methanoplasma termitum]AIZ56880.1 caspase domain protein [Candidatus Methanoplasma termitum]
MFRKALIIGINNYPRSPLSGCINDATAVAELLKTNHDGTKNFDVLLINDVKSKSELMKHIKSLFDGANDVSLLYFSGHGCFDEIGGYLVTPDYKENDMGVNMRDIITLASKSRSRDRIVIADCCHSGMLGSMDITEDTTVLREGMTIMAACNREESAIESCGHGVFTNLLVEGLKGGASDLSGNVSPGGLYAYIDRSLGPWDQRPIFKTNVARFSTIRKTAPPIARETMMKITEIFNSPDTELQLDPSFECTNNPTTKPLLLEPFSDEKNVKTFKILQQLESVGIVVPIGERHMYYAAMNSKSCKLTSLGKHYYYLSKIGRI